MPTPILRIGAASGFSAIGPPPLVAPLWEYCVRVATCCWQSGDYHRRWRGVPKGHVSLWPVCRRVGRRRRKRWKAECGATRLGCGLSTTSLSGNSASRSSHCAIAVRRMSRTSGCHRFKNDSSREIRASRPRVAAEHPTDHAIYCICHGLRRNAGHEWSRRGAHARGAGELEGIGAENPIGNGTAFRRLAGRFPADQSI
jgi:hypothetical protein